jgi:hypothetical protein
MAVEGDMEGDEKDFEMAVALALEDAVPVLAEPLERPLPDDASENKGGAIVLARPSWLENLPAVLTIGPRCRPIEDAFRGLSELQVATRLKYGFDHIRSMVTTGTFLSIRRRGVESNFRLFDGALEPPTQVTATPLRFCTISAAAL